MRFSFGKVDQEMDAKKREKKAQCKSRQAHKEGSRKIWQSTRVYKQNEEKYEGENNLGKEYILIEVIKIEMIIPFSFGAEV